MSKRNGNSNALCVNAIRTALAEEHDWQVAADNLLAEMSSDVKTLRMWLNYALPQAVRTEATRVRMSEFQRYVANDNESLERFTVRVPIEGMGKRLWRSSTVLDCTREELVTLRDLYNKRADENAARANAIGRLIDAIDRFDAKTARELPPETVREALVETEVLV